MSRLRKLLLSALIVGGVATVASSATYSAFSSSSKSLGNAYAAGTVQLGDNDAGAAMLGLASATPGASDASCIRVTYTGSLGSRVRLYGSVAGTLAPHLTLVVTRGTETAPSFDSCATFTPDATDYVGAGAGVIYSGTLSGFPATYAAGIVDPRPATPESWTFGEAHSYRFVVTMGGDPAAQAQSASASFTWEAQNE